MDDQSEKPCLACGQSIRQNARKCPHCCSWQYRMYTGWFHPATWTVLILVFGVMVLIPVGSIIHDIFHKRAIAYEPSRSISVVDSKVHYGEQKDCPYVSCIGTLRNNTDV